MAWACEKTESNKTAKMYGETQGHCLFIVFAFEQIVTQFVRPTDLKQLLELFIWMISPG